MLDLMLLVIGITLIAVAAGSVSLHLGFWVIALGLLLAIVLEVVAGR